MHSLAFTLNQTMIEEENIEPVPGVKPGSFAAWCASFRPKTLGIAAAPVIVGLSVSAAVTHTFDLIVAFATLALSLLMQAISNMENDAGYTKRRAERKSRKGLPRSTANGWLTVAQVERMIKILIGIVALDTFFLIYVGGWAMLAISVASVVAAYAYMGGPKPIAYTPWGEFVVFIFFGPIAVAGTAYLQTGVWQIEALLAGSALGFIASAVLAVNNYRDTEHDAEVGRRTLAVILGRQAMVGVYCSLLYAPYLMVAVAIVYNPSVFGLSLCLLALPRTLKLVDELPRREGNDLNAVMFGTVKLELLFSLCLTVGGIVSVVLL